MLIDHYRRIALRIIFPLRQKAVLRELSYEKFDVDKIFMTEAILK